MSDPPLRIWLAVTPARVFAYEHKPTMPIDAGWSVHGPYVLEAQTTARHLPIVGEVD